MFAHFIYFIIALLILSPYEAPEELPYSLSKSITLFIAISLLYTLYIRQLFRNLLRKFQWDSRAKLDHRFGQLTTRCAILSLVMLCIDVWWLHLPAHLSKVPLFSILPTLNYLIFLFIFMGYLILMWTFSYETHKTIYQTDISIKDYVFSNIAFSVPVLIPWTLLFGIHDLIRLLPFDFPKKLIDTPMGQTVYFLLFLIVAAIFAPVLIQRFWRCRPLGPGEHRSRIEALCRKANVRYADIVYWPIFGGRVITAGVMGLVARFRYILVTDALINMLTSDEVDQVIAHEIGHVKHKHLLLYLLFFIGFIQVSDAAFSIAYYFFYFTKPVILFTFTFGINNDKTFLFFSYAILIIVIILYFRYLFGFFIRNFERQADLYVFKLYASAQPLISTFKKIVFSSGQPADKPNWHHFSIQQRIDYLYQCERSPSSIARHSRKVRNSIAIFISCLILLGLSIFFLKQYFYDEGDRYYKASSLEIYLEQKENKTPTDGFYYFALGDHYVSLKNYEKAATLYETGIDLYPEKPTKIKYLTRVGGLYYEMENWTKAAGAWEKALNLAPENPEALNNMAWLLSTSKNESLRNPKRALVLAEKAVRIERTPHILDTLAECYYANGLIEDAIITEQQVLKMNPENPQLYKDQLAKFKKALKKKEKS